MRKIILVSLWITLLCQSCKIKQRYHVNEEFNIELEKEGDGGYQWGYVAIPEVKQLNSSKKKIVEEGKLLASYHKVFSLKGVKPGVYKLEFQFLRSFEKLDTIPKDQIKIIKVKIKK